MTQYFSKQPSRTPPEPFSEVKDPALTSGLFWTRLLTYRPLFLLGGLWLALVCVSAIAYHGLMFNKPIEDATYAEAPLTVVDALPQARPSASGGLPTDNTASANAAAPANNVSSRSGPVTLWVLFSLVGLCGFGCFVLTQQIRASARPTRPSKRRKLRPRPVVKSATPVLPPQPKRLAPYSPQRDGVVVPGARIIETSVPRRSLKNSPVRPQPGNKPQAVARAMPRPDRPSQPRVAAAAPVPSRHPAVVPNETDLSLDWPEGSVAHALDVRQRRSLSSFM